MRRIIFNIRVVSFSLFALIGTDLALAHECESEEVFLEQVCTGPRCRERIEISVDENGVKQGRFVVRAEFNGEAYECRVKLDAEEYKTFCRVRDEDRKLIMLVEVTALDDSTDTWVSIFPHELPEKIDLVVKRGFKTLLELEDFEPQYDRLVWSVDGCYSCKAAEHHFYYDRKQ